MCAKFQQKILNFVAVGARQSFQFFSEIIELRLSAGIEFCITWLLLPNYKKITP